ncbi:hypothetical protein QR556_06230 [Acinetobacter soli]|uniref:hypothetical protein n=1 Tax=Acinetobacter soli TaxID=487316 RepID=UPI002D7F5427|nr:hypothetical protein [Acinetobacter soli]MEB4800565.1 hypothetical protein [Acinetobacter soli]
MIDLELERKAFEELSYKNGVRNFTKDDLDNGYRSAELDYNWHIWIKSAESKQAEIDSLKAQLRESNDTVQHLRTESSGVHAALREQQRINEDLLDKLLGVDAGEYVVVPKSKLNTCYWDEANNSVGYYEQFDTLEEAKKAAAHYKATIVAGY